MTNPLSRERKPAQKSSDPLWLTVEQDGKNTSYELPPGGDDTTVVVGSSDRAQIRVAGAAPIAFCVERVENELCISGRRSERFFLPCAWRG